MAPAEPERPWRCFVAVPIGGELREAVAACSSALQALPEAHAWSWTDAAGWHVTLAFLGATDPARVPSLGRALAAIARRGGTFTVACGGLGAFPSRGRARVLWYGVTDTDGRLRDLAREVQAATGLQPEDRFRAHLTLARARDRSGTDAGPLLASGQPPEGQIEVDHMVLYRSHLGRGPARYEALAVAPLSGAAR
jgi:2'-5' RNA ligase